VRSGSHRAILVVISCTYSRVAPETDTLAWANGDGATAFVVGPVPAGQGLLGISSIHTADGCGAMYYEIDGSSGVPQIRMRSGEHAASSLRRISERGVRECCHGAAAKAGVSLDDIDFFVMPTPTAWHAAFCAKALGFARERTINTHPVFANTGPVLMPTNLFYAALSKRIEPGSLVMVHTVGVVSTASAAVLRWGDVGLGDPPVMLSFDPATGDAQD
jgi:3-oxoacyl-[acyl-carrier-protein] synthase-3